MPYRIVIDTNVLIAAMRSRLGASFRLLALIGDPGFEIAISPALVLEYEAVALRPESGVTLPADAIQAILDRLCLLGRRTRIHYRWRPALPDAGDELVLELAAAAGCRYIVTFNARDFQGSKQFGVEAISPGAFLRLMGEPNEHDQPAPA